MSIRTGKIETPPGPPPEPALSDSPSSTRPHSGPSATALAAKLLRKTYGKRRVVDDVSLHVERGPGVGLFGANGAGKPTTFYIIDDLEHPDSGEVPLGDR